MRAYLRQQILRELIVDFTKMHQSNLAAEAYI